LERQVDTHVDVLQHLRLDSRQRGPLGFQDRQYPLLIGEPQRLLAFLPGPLACFEQAVVELAALLQLLFEEAALLQLLFEEAALLFGGVQAVRERLTYASIIT
jgi:hypothetical protein